MKVIDEGKIEFISGGLGSDGDWVRGGSDENWLGGSEEDWKGESNNDWGDESDEDWEQPEQPLPLVPLAIDLDQHHSTRIQISGVASVMHQQERGTKINQRKRGAKTRVEKKGEAAS